ncbi:MAG: hypothetical protein JOZ43_02860, partial [Acidobacteriales bacterium]|nr:hypothetical protein [Terriglobales bacterium]
MRKIVAFVLSCTALFAQHEHAAEAAADEKPVALYAGLGSWHHPISTSNVEAQKYFDQGLILLYSFNRYEALRSFRKAAELDSHGAMPCWGMAMALGPYLNMDMDPSYQIKDSCDAAKTGLALQNISETDRGWLNGAAARCPDYSDPGRYIGAMREVAAHNPDDPDAQTLYAEALILPVRWHCYDQHGKAASGVPEAGGILESVLRRFPNHPGANHLYIHVVEASPTPERAIPSAQRLMGIVPAAGHMVHMPGHIWLVLGDFNTAAAVNERAAQVDREYFAKTGVIGSYYPYYLHNLQFILYSRAMQGRVAETNAAVAQMTAAIRSVMDTMPEMADFLSGSIPTTELRVYQWDEVLARERPRSDSALRISLWHYTRAVAFAGRAQLDEARQEQTEFESLCKKVDRSAPWDTNKTGDVMDLASAILKARVAVSRAAAIEYWRRAVELQDALAYGEPPAWYYPVR